MHPSRRPLLLLLSDDPESASALRELLTRAGYGVETVRTPAEAAARLAGTSAPDLLILQGIQSESAAADVEEIRRAARAPYLPVLALTAAEGAEDGDVPTGVDDLLPYPIEPRRLLARVASLIGWKRRFEGMGDELRRLTEVGIALSAEPTLPCLLERLLQEARALTGADAGTLYSVDREAGVLRFRIIQNDSLGIRLGSESGNRIKLPPVPLSEANVSGHVALSGEAVNIPDVYEAAGFDFSGPRKYDALTGYRSRSMLVVPIRGHEEEVTAVLQLINARDLRTGEVTPFPARSVEQVLALASQAGIALTNARLINDLQAFLEGVLEVMASAIDEKSAYTAGHIRRVTQLCMLLADAVNRDPDGPHFSSDELEELRVAGLLHDIGKLVIPDHIADKATKLQSVYDRIEEIRSRFSVIRRGFEIDALREKLALAQSGAPAEALQAMDARLEEQCWTLDEDLVFLACVNTGGEFLTPEKQARLEEIAGRTYVDDDGIQRPWLTENELRNLSIQRGTLLPEELEVVRTHAAVSGRLLSRIPFSRKLRNVPVIAGDHHEALNGSGYPRGKSGDQISLQSRILAIADVFDALTAMDRPYKKAYPVEVAYQILRDEARAGKLDAGLVELFISANCPARLGRSLDEHGAEGDTELLSVDRLFRPGRSRRREEQELRV